MKSLAVTVILLSVILLSVAGPLRAQPPSAPPRLGLEAGLGAGSSSQQQIPLFSVSARVMRCSGPVLLSLRGTASTMIWSDGFADAALLAGFAAGDGLGNASLSAGPALTHIERATGTLFGPVFSADEQRDRRSSSVTMLGLAVAGRVRITAPDPLGLSLGVFGNLNKEEAFGGLTLSLFVAR